MASIDIKPFKSVPNLMHVLPTYANEEEGIINGVIEINAGTINKYEIVNEYGVLKLDRVGYSTLAYPVAYGAIPQTWDLDNDALDFVIANVTETLIPGSYAELRIIGIMKFVDGDEVDDKVITVINDDKRQSHITTVEDLGEHFAKELTYYFEHYKDLKKPGTCKVEGIFGVDKAKEVISEARERYKSDYLPRFEE